MKIQRIRLETNISYPDAMDLFYNNIKNGVICLLLLLDVCLLSSCKTNNVVKVKIVTINNECIRNVVGNMFSFADSITDCKYDYYYLIKNQGEKETESFTLQSTNIQEIYSHFGKTTLLMDTLGGHILLFPEKTVDFVGGYGEFHCLKTIIDDKNNSTEKSVSNEALTFDGCEDVTWHFNYHNNKIQVTDIDNYRMNLYDWLIYAKDTMCMDNPLLYRIEIIED